ncbi:MAG TPA: DUF11 domain-containing protein [bacterium]|nr:DUF11 domain-containing protein [bacterium]
MRGNYLSGALALAFFLQFFSPGGADAAPFPSTPAAYLSNSPSSTTQLIFIDQTADPYAFDNIGAGVSPIYNSMGFNPTDQFLYAFANSTNAVFRIHSDGSVDDLGPTTGWGPPAFNDFNSAAGTFTAAGTFLIGSSTRLVEIDVTTTPATVLSSVTLTGVPFGSNFSDWAIHPLTGALYGVAGNTLRNIDPGTGAVTAIGANGCDGCGNPGAAWFGADGSLFVQVNSTGDFYRGDVATGAFSLVANGPTSSSQDAASNPFAPDLEKSVSPATVEVGNEVTYTYTILNPGPSVGSADFSDTLPAGLVYVAGSLANPFGGTVNSYAGTDTLTIAGLTIPAGSGSSITVQVLASTTGIKENQAELTFTTLGVPTNILSDEPGNALKPDPTTLDVVLIPVPTPTPTPTPSPTPPPPTPEANLGITKAVLSGQPVTVGSTVQYQVTVSNLGPDEATGVRVTDLQSGPFAAISNIGGDLSDGDCAPLAGDQNGVECDLPNIPNGGSVTFTYETSLSAEGTWNDQVAVASIEQDPVLENRLANAFVISSDPPSVSDLSIEVTPSSPSVPPGQPIDYTMTIVNHGPDDAQDVVLTGVIQGAIGDISMPQLPPGVTGGCGVSGNTFTCNIDSIPAGSGPVAVTFSVTPTAPGLIDIQLTVGGGTEDPNLGNNAVINEVVAQQAPPTPTPTPNPTPPPTPTPTPTPFGGLIEGSGNIWCSMSPGEGSGSRWSVLGLGLGLLGMLSLRLRGRKVSS